MQVFRPLSTFVPSFPVRQRCVWKWMELRSTSTHAYVVQQTLNLLSTLECRRSNRHWNVRCTEPTQKKASNSPAFVELVWSKHRTNVDLSENGKVRHCHLACSHSQRQHNDSARCSLMSKTSQNSVYIRPWQRKQPGWIWANANLLPTNLLWWRRSRFPASSARGNGALFKSLVFRKLH